MTKVAHSVNGGSVAIHPFHVKVPDTELADLRRRILATRLPEKEPVADNSQGIPLAMIHKLQHYWANEYDWRKVEARINAVPNFVTEIDGLDIHFIHARSKHESALPLLITHGWPGTFIEQLKIIDPLINPTAHGGYPEDAFHVVVPSLPGYGYSGKPAQTGWDPARIARAWGVLMERLGYTRYVAQGTDWGAITTEIMATQGHTGLVGIHTNMPGVVPSEIDPLLWTGDPLPANLSADERHACKKLISVYQNVRYALYMASRPQTLYAIADSPVGLAAWLLDGVPSSQDLFSLTFDGLSTGLTRDDVLDSPTLFWLTNTGVSAARLYRENQYNYFVPKGISIPVAVSVFPDELYQAPRSWVEKAFPKLLHYNRLPKGGHFPAWEQPQLLIEELRTSFSSLR